MMVFVLTQCVCSVQEECDCVCIDSVCVLCRKEAIVFVFVLSTAVSMALLLLISWHARLIHRGETSIEVYINGKEMLRLRKKGLVSRTRSGG